IPWQGRVGLGTLTNWVIDQRPAPALPIVSTVTGFLVYGSYVLQQLRHGGSPNSTDMQLAPNGANAFAVLRNWLSKRDYRPAYEFVVRQVGNAFPGISEDIEFEFAANITSLRLHNSLRTERIPVTLAPNGWLAGLL